MTRTDRTSTRTADARVSFHETVLANGLTLIGEHNPEAQSFAAGYFVKTGSRDETSAVAGVSHFLEHMMFKGTFKRSAEAINLEFDALGANYNAYTSDERTVYYGAVLPERGAALIDLLTDMMRPALRESDFDLEKNVILEEIAMYDDRPSFKVFEEGNARFFQGHPLGQSVLGTPESIRALTQAQMLTYFRARYASNNLLLAVAGRYDWDEVVAQVERLTETWGPSRAERRYPALSSSSGDTRLALPNLARAHTALYAPGVSAQDPLRYAAGVLANCLGDGSGSRLYWALLDNGLADSASLSHDAADGAGTFVGYLSTHPEGQAEALGVYHEVLLQVQREGLAQDEWARAQRKLATGLTLRGETPFGRLMSLGVRYQQDGRYASVQEIIDRIMAASLTDAEALLSGRPFDRLFSFTLEPERA